MNYDLKEVKAPRLKGVPLRLFTWIMENRLLRPIVLPNLLKTIGVRDFRKLRPKSAPTLFPLLTSGGSTLEKKPPHDGPDAGESIAASAPGSSANTFRFTSVTDYAKAYRDGSITPDKVARRIITAIESSNRGDLPLRAIIKCDTEDIERQAAESSERLAQGKPRSILEGVPVAIKDELDMPPYTTHVGTGFLGKEIPAEDATPISRLRAAGALLIGKANMFEIGISPTGDNPIHGFARNPYNLHHDTGGSSSGCGAAVGSGMVPFAIGADGGGSIRVPAAHCGVVGLKPTFGRVSEFGAAPLCWSVAHVGPLGATALDTAIAYAFISGKDPKDPISLDQPPVRLDDFHNHDLSGIKLGIYRPWFEDASPEIVGSCRDSLKVLEEAGAVIKEITIADLEATRAGHAITILTEMAAAMEPHYGNHRQSFGHVTRINLALARQFTGRDYILAQRIRTEALHEWKRVFSEVDAVITPTTACTAPPLDPATLRYGSSDMGQVTELMRFVVAANFCGLPAISFPSGYTSKGLPIGIQAIGPHWDEHLLLRLANISEQKFDRKKPTAFYEPLR